MSDRSVEDEIAAEARKFGHSMAQLLRLHAQAGTWLERRKLRKQISRTLREQRRQEEADRGHQLVWTEQTIDRYRAHSLAVADRASDPSVDHARRYRDAQALTRHAQELRARIVTNARLTEVERGIALDGVDAATTFPQFETDGGRLFSGAHKVRGIEALRYRAQVARTREALGVDRGRVEQQWTASLADAGRRNSENIELGRIEAAQPDQDRYLGQMIWTDRHGGTTIEARSVPTEHAATDWMRRTVDGSMWTEGTSLRVQITDSHAERDRVLYSDHGHPDQVADRVEMREQALREQVLAGHVHRDQVARSQPPDPAPQPQQPQQRSDGDRLAAIERQLNDVGADRDKLSDRVAILQRGLDAVTADRNVIRKSLTAAEGRIEELKNRNIRLANEIGELRDRPDATQVVEERDRYKRERDEAVAKLHARTPAKDRYGSAEKVAHERLGDTQAWPAPGRNGHGRNGAKRSR
ncbi:hypothetical protein [Nocardia xishanensis]|uniref:hypothetical protein n=1 Tax=Nocardia xishanensis TaxID=238964 RepID=UPI0034145D0F